ncbi:MAG: heavy-metal-associated domain-containing protein [Spirochaetaceae bacterium]|nr:heavy-metal-associated domain-containing protein [Spirochaetaceae bacterium]
MVKLIVKDMMCQHCVKKIDNALEDANIKHEINLEDKTVSVDVDSMQLLEVLEKLENLGYSAERA